jgi:hypothetical protein
MDDEKPDCGRRQRKRENAFALLEVWWFQDATENCQTIATASFPFPKTYVPAIIWVLGTREGHLLKCKR